MDAAYTVAAFLAALTLAYLVVALIRPTWFGG